VTSQRQERPLFEEALLAWGQTRPETEMSMTVPLTRIDPHTFGPWAIVTGASSGIGKEFARQLAASGLNLVLVARRRSLLEELGSQLATAFGVEYRAVEVDLTEPGFLDTITARTGDLDVGLLVSNAGAVTVGEFLALERRTVDMNVRLNVLAHLSLVQHYSHHLAERGRGGVLLVSSTVGAHGAPFMADYAAAKAYVLMLGQALHLEFQQQGLHLTVLMPGPTATEGVAASGLDLPAKLMSVEQCVAEGLNALKLNRATHIAGQQNRFMAAVVPGSVMRKMMGHRDTPYGQAS
jgi:short-subunit dehydrogenase